MQAAATTAELPAGLVATGGEPVERLNDARSRICLNGLWAFCPADTDQSVAASTWGWIRVPGTWNGRKLMPGIAANGSGAAWDGFDGAKLGKAWYERTISIPADWAGRAVVLDLRRVSTDAQVWIDGKQVGSLTWPGGEVDLTAVVEPGRDHRLRVLVAAVQTADKVLDAMGVGQNKLVDAKLESRGIIGEVFLSSRPQGPRIDDVFVRTYVRSSRIAFDVALAGAKPGKVAVEVIVREGAVPGGPEAKRFRATTDATIASGIQVAFDWADAKRWDLKQPNLYTAEVRLRGDGWQDAWTQRFGFREVEVAGREIRLNGTRFNLRPTTAIPEGGYSQINGQIEAIDLAIDSILEAGYNCNELWPGDETVRGTVTFRDLIIERCDLKGLPVMAPARSAKEIIRSWPPPMRWNDPGVQEGYERDMMRELRTMRNSPSAIIWTTTANVFGHVEDQDPRRMGRDIRDEAWKDTNIEWREHMARGQQLCDLIKRHDPTRPVLVHQGGPLGDIYAVNNYLCLIPLQERSEYPSAWAAAGDMPYCAIEFGTPLHCTMMRGRDGFGNNTVSEPLMSEFCAVYFGNEAYRSETASYRTDVRSRWQQDLIWQNWHFRPSLDGAPAFQRLQEVFLKRTWETWRTWGVSGGMIPWTNAQGYEGKAGITKQSPWTPGLRGTWSGEFRTSAARPFSADGQDIRPAGRMLARVNGDTLAWIAGPMATRDDPAAWTAMDHLYRPGERISKSVVLIADARKPVSWAWTIRAEGADGRTVAEGKGKTEAAIAEPGSVEFIPFAFDAPDQDVRLILRAEADGRVHEDTFTCRVVPAPRPARGTLAVHDPEGATALWLKELGYATVPWTGDGKLPVVIGRRAWSGGGLPGDPATVTAAGGRVLVMAQDPEWTAAYLGLRLAGHVSRIAFALPGGSPLTQDLSDDLLRDWRGHGSLVEAFPVYGSESRRAPSGAPYAGWRWGTRGSIASAMFEKPHRSGWRPLAEGEFDLAYTPAMELDLGQGRVTFCAFDFEGRIPADPAASLIAARLVERVVAAPLAPRQAAIYVGDDAGAALLDALGAEYRREQAIPARPGLVLAGAGADDAQLRSALAAGARVLCLPRRSEHGPLGLTLAEAKDFDGSLQAPAWPEAGGLSLSELRRRAPGPAWIIRTGDGAEVASDGLLARIAAGPGVAIACQLDPDLLDADRIGYNRYTRWRQHRALAQLIANLGGSFAADRRALVPFSAESGRIALHGDWQARYTDLKPKAAKPGDLADVGMSEAAKRLMAEDAPEDGWATVKAPGMLPQLKEQDGEVVLRRFVDVPASLAGAGELQLALGALDDFDITYVNGVEVGRTGSETKDSWRANRLYSIKTGIIKPGRNVIAVRLFDHFGGGGFNSVKKDLYLARPPVIPPPSLYHPDYRSDFPLGDDPYRYYRW